MKCRILSAITVATLSAAAHLSAFAAEPTCIDAHAKEMSSLYSIISKDESIADELANIHSTEVNSDDLRQKHVIDYISNLRFYIAENQKKLMTPCGVIASGEEGTAWTLYRSNLLGIKLDPDGNPQKQGFDIGRRLVDKANFSSERYTHKVPFLISYRNDKVSDESGFNILGDIGYRFSVNLSGWHAISASIDVDTTKSVADSTVDIGYGRTWIAIHGKDQERFFDETVTELAMVWNTDRDFKRKAYSAQLSVTPAIDSIGAGGYINDKGPFVWAWSPSIVLTAGHVINANGNDEFLAIQQAGSFVQAAPAVAISISPRNHDKLQFVVGYARTFDLKSGRDEGMLQAGLSYQLIGPASLTAVFRKGYESPFFKEVNDYLVGIGIEY